MHFLSNIPLCLQKQADNHLLYDLLCQIAPWTPVTLWELRSLLSTLLWVSIVHYLHSLWWMYLNVVYSSMLMNTFFFFCIYWLFPWTLESVLFVSQWFLCFNRFWIKTLYWAFMNRHCPLDTTCALSILLNTDVIGLGHLNRRGMKEMALSTFWMKPRQQNGRTCRTFVKVL